MIYMKGTNYVDLTAIGGLLYFGEAYVYQLLQLKDLDGSKDQQEPNKAEKLKAKGKPKPNHMVPRSSKTENETTYDSNKIGGSTFAQPKTVNETTYNSNKMKGNTLAQPKTSKPDFSWKA